MQIVIPGIDGFPSASRRNCYRLPVGIVVGIRRNPDRLRPRIAIVIERNMHTWTQNTGLYVQLWKFDPSIHGTLRASYFAARRDFTCNGTGLYVHYLCPIEPVEDTSNRSVSSSGNVEIARCQPHRPPGAGKRCLAVQRCCRLSCTTLDTREILGHRQ